MALANAPPPPVSLLLFNGLIILAFLSIPFIALRIIFLLPPLRPPPRPRRRPGSTGTSTATESLLAAGERDGDDDADEDGDTDQLQRQDPTRLLVVLGSGGHTAEMMAMLRKLDARTFLRSWSHRTYVVSEGDGFSAERAREFEEQLLEEVATAKRRKNEKGEGKTNDSNAAMEKNNGQHSTEDEQEQGLNGDANPEQKTIHSSSSSSNTPPDPGTYTLHIVPRARAIHQSLLTTPLSALRCLLACVSILQTPAPPDLILTNGPGTAVVVILTALLLRFADVGDGRGTSRVRTVYVESWARVTRLSLSGRLLLRVVDRFVVQWEGLVERTGGKAEFLGVLV
ncbi:UDP-N-acetylglucosamine transferase subunit ALG14 [Lasiodiplodia theobromae]|uniref:UDP-N-acetylglucosamine transferase subunit ALG14 n=1 Tax=Lasiodiplodia theobromae TaxID=45133 RepID=A0A5N5DBF9_9PEZI|nr:UDP-N-acetylglucosamine transferase subunit ALG14 [Lasiodiplodia theobromae]